MPFGHVQQGVQGRVAPSGTRSRHLRSVGNLSERELQESDLHGEVAARTSDEVQRLRTEDGSDQSGSNDRGQSGARYCHLPRLQQAETVLLVRNHRVWQLHTLRSSTEDHREAGGPQARENQRGLAQRGHLPQLRELGRDG